VQWVLTDLGREFAQRASEIVRWVDDNRGRIIAAREHHKATTAERDAEVVTANTHAGKCAASHRFAQSISRSRRTAGASGLFILSHWSVRPEW